jgi:WD40 repeat protein/serine/threonine protein kinase/acyl-coenzyme A thioesterase PaaI-like protein
MRSSDAQGHDLPTDTPPSESPERKSTGHWAESSTRNSSSADPVDARVSTDPLVAPVLTAPPATGVPGARYIQHYELIRELGRGGMGVVHLARDLRLGRLVAIKMLTRRGHLQERFLAEARATARCRHENIVVIHEVGVHGDKPYLVFEYLRGQTLRQWMDAWLGGAFEVHDSSGAFAQPPTSLAPARAVEMIVPVVRALVCAHDMGIVHRDLKPANILLTDEGVTKVLDFGVAKTGAMREDIGIEAAVLPGEPLDLTARGVRLGTLPYMSPEQLAGESVDHRSDIWAVGIILYELVTGSHPLAPLSPARLYALVDGPTPMPGVRAHQSDLGPLADITDRCLLKDREHRTATSRELLQELEALLPPPRTRARDQDRNPFAGLAAFQEPDADRFFGRDHEITSLVSKLRSLPLVAVTGPSGAGKSSLVRAGVIPALKRSGEGWNAMVTRPGRQPLAMLAEVLLAVAERSSEQPPGRDVARDQVPAEHDAIVTRLRAEPGYLGIALRTWARARLRRLVLFIDQFEELYTLGADDEERACVLACLGGVADDVASPLRVILSVRSDFLDRLVEERAIRDQVSHGLTFLSSLDRDGLRDALTRPVEACDHRFESPAMVERILDELGATRSPLPLLQFTADKLWARRDRRQCMLTESSLAALGGVSGALASHADAVLASMPAHDARLARAVFLRLVTPERTRALATLAELRQLGGDAESMSRVLARLIDARLLAVAGSHRSEPDSSEFDGEVEIVHESLIDTWPLLGQWLVESEEDAIFLARLRSAARDWERGGHAPGLLWTAEAAGEARAWHQRYQGDLAPAERRYLEAVLLAAERARSMRRRLFGGVLATALAVAIAMAWLAWQHASASQAAVEAATRATHEATRAQEEARRAEAEAVRARDATRMGALRASSTDPTTQLALLREIEGIGAPPPGALREARRLLHAGVTPVVLMGHDHAVLGAAFSPDGSRIVSASLDKTVRVWNADGSGKSLVLRGHEDGVLSAQFSPDGSRILSASKDQTMRVWNADGSGEPLVLRGHDDKIATATFSPNGRRIVFASWDKTVQVWNADGSGEPLALHGHDDAVLSAEFSPDGRSIVSASRDKTVRVWRADHRSGHRVLRGHHDTVFFAAFSPDGRRIVSASLDKTVRVWNADGSGPLVLRGHSNAVYSVAFSPDGRRIVSASSDKTVRVWNADGSGEPLVLRGHDDAVYFAVFSPDGRRIVSASWDQTVRVWNAADSEPLMLRGHKNEVHSAAFSPDGRRIVSASSDKTVRVWNADGSDEPLVLRDHDGEIYSAAFSPDGRRIVSASRDKTVRVWNVDGSGEPLVLRGHNDAVSSAAFSADGQRIVSASWDKTVRVWGIDDRGDPLVLRGHGDVVTSAAFDPSGQRVVSGSWDRTVRIWNADGSSHPLVLRGHDDMVMSASFSSDGQQIVSASRDKTLRVWNADGTGLPLVLRGHDAPINRAAFSPDGSSVVFASKDTTIRIWRPDGANEPVILTGHSASVSQAQYSPDGRHIVSASADHTVRVWHDLTPVSIDDPRLWTATNYCMPVERRIEVLGVSEEQARRDRQHCLERVEQARPADAAQPP